MVTTEVTTEAMGLKKLTGSSTRFGIDTTRITDSARNTATEEVHGADGEFDLGW